MKLIRFSVIVLGLVVLLASAGLADEGYRAVTAAGEHASESGPFLHGPAKGLVPLSAERLDAVHAGGVGPMMPISAIQGGAERIILWDETFHGYHTKGGGTRVNGGN